MGLSVTMAYLRCLSRTDHAPQSVVQLAGTSQLAVTTNRRVQSTQVGQRGSECQSVQHLTQQTDDSGKKQKTPPTDNQQMKLYQYIHAKKVLNYCQHLCDISYFTMSARSTCITNYSHKAVVSASKTEMIRNFHL